LENQGAAAWGDKGEEKVQWTFSPKNARPVGGPGCAVSRLPKGRQAIVGQKVPRTFCDPPPPDLSRDKSGKKSQRLHCA